MSRCKLLFFVGVFPKNVPFTEPVMTPMLSIIWKMNWADGSATASAEQGAKAMTVDVSNHPQVSGGSMSAQVRYDIYKLHPSIQTPAQAQAVLDNPAFDWAKDALAISLQSMEVGLTGNPGSTGACTVSP